MNLLGRMGWVYGRILGVGGSSLTIPNLMWEMAPKLISGMICCVEIWLLSMPFYIYLSLRVRSMLLLRLTWSFEMAPVVSFVRAAHDWEVDVFAFFFKVLNSTSVRRKGEDKLWWIPSKRGLFAVRSFYNVLIRNDGLHFPWKSVWQTKVPFRAAFFA